MLPFYLTQTGVNQERAWKHIYNILRNKDLEFSLKDVKLEYPDVIPGLIIKKGSVVTTKLGSLSNSEIEELL
jgi:hypothetical protein